MIRGLLFLAIAAHAQTVQGVTVNSATHKPVAGATVQLIGAAPEQDAEAELELYRGRSDEAGRFRFDGVVPGHYRAIADAPGFPRANLAGRVARVSVAPGASVPEVTVAMTPAAVISGRVVDQDGDPIAYASVEALQFGYQSGKKSLQQIGNARSDDHGEYRIFGLMPGRYYVRAAMRAGAAATYAPTFFPGQRDVSQASLLEAPAGGELHSIDIMLHQEELHNATGKVVDGQTGQAVANVYVMARTADGFANGGAQLADSFTIHGLMPGKYVLTAYESGGGTGRSARQVVDVGSADLTGVVLTLTAGLEVAGTVRTGSEVPDNATKIHFFLQGEDANTEGHVNASGAVAFHNVRPDHYHLLWTIPKGTYVKSIKLGDRLLPDDSIDLTGPPAPLAIQLATDGGRIQGVVRNSTGEPVAGAVVTMNSGTAYDVWTATSDDAGQYAIRDIAPGDYRVLAFDDAPQGAPQDPDFRKPFEKSATPLQVLPSTQQKIDLVAVPGR
jgi:hypothetical protein